MQKQDSFTLPPLFNIQLSNPNRPDSNDNSINSHPNESVLFCEKKNNSNEPSILYYDRKNYQLESNFIYYERKSNQNLDSLHNSYNFNSKFISPLIPGSINMERENLKDDEKMLISESINDPTLLFRNENKNTRNFEEKEEIRNSLNNFQSNQNMKTFNINNSKFEKFNTIKEDQVVEGKPIELVDALLPKSGYEKLLVPGLYVKQKTEWLEIFSGCETENTYKVYACDVSGKKEGHPLFKCREKSGCAERQCLPGDCRNFSLEVAHDSEGRLSLDGHIFIEIKRPFKFTFFCFQRPYIEITFKENGGSLYIGKVIHNFDIFKMNLSIFDKNENLKFNIAGSIFQIGLMNYKGCMCRGCQQAFCFIYDKKMEIVGIIEKRGKGFKNLISDSDNFSILFPIKSTLEDRALILAATLFLDFRYFEISETTRSAPSNASYHHG